MNSIDAAAAIRQRRVFVGIAAGAALLVVLPVFLKLLGVDLLGWPTDIVAHLNLVIVGGLIWLIGWRAYLMIHLPITVFSGAMGIWLFYVQHQFEGVYWERREDWDYLDAALKGSSFYKLPRVLQWFTGNIGFHHIHHLSPAIPNYNLERCHRETPLFRQVEPVTLWRSLKSLSFRLWDEQRRKLVGYRRLRTIRREMSSPQAGG